MDADYTGKRLLVVEKTGQLRDIAGRIIPGYFPGLSCDIADRFSGAFGLVSSADCILTAPFDFYASDADKERYFNALRGKPNSVILLGDLAHEQDAKRNGFHYAFRPEVVDAFLRIRKTGHGTKYEQREVSSVQGQRLIQLIEEILLGRNTKQVVLRNHRSPEYPSSKYSPRRNGCVSGHEPFPDRWLPPLHSRG